MTNNKNIQENDILPKKVLLISLNGAKELGGGGIYLRSIIDLLRLSTSNLTVISKIANDINTPDFQYLRTIFLEKNRFIDIINRFFFQPTFLFFDYFKIKNIILQNDIIIIHNTRNGVFVKLAKKLSKKVIICSDNVEYLLVKNYGRRLITVIERPLVYKSEKTALKYADVCTFITRNDWLESEKVYGMENKSSFVLPVSLKFQEITYIPKEAKENCRILFTGNFGFAPNQHALEEYVRIASQLSHTEIEFVVVGKELKKITLPSYIKTFSDVTEEELQYQFKSADIFLSPVSIGSGMKTKIAEALSYGLYVVTSVHSAIGYEAAFEEKNGCIYKYSNLNEAIQIISELSQKTLDKKWPIKIFKKYYSLEAQGFLMRKILKILD